MTSRSTAEQFMPALLYAPVPLLLAAAARFGSRGASGGIFIVTVVALWFVMQGQGPFFTTGAGRSVFALQFFLVTVSVPVILIAALVEQLHRANSSLTAVLAGISDCYYMLDREWRFAIVAPKAAAWLGQAPDSIIGAKASDMRTEGEPLVRQAAGDGVPIHAEVPSAVHPGRWIDLHAYPWSEGISVFFRDVSGRKKAEQALRDSEESFRIMAQTVPDILFTSYPEGGCAYLSARFYEYTGLSPAAALGFGWTDALHPDDRERVLTARQNAGQTGEALALECRLRAADGTYRWFVARWRPILNAEGRTAKWFGAITDIDDLKQGEAALRRLTGKLLAAQDEERRRIARELHDSTAQDLLGIAFGIHKVLRMSADMPAGATAALEETQRLIDKCQKEIRAISYLMHPPMLGEAGLVSALRWFIEGFIERTGIRVDLDIGPDPGRLPPDVETALFRVAQEALANVHRHSGSASASIRLHRRRTPGAEDCVVLAITDEGRGLPPDIAGAFASGTRRAAARVGVGLLGMDERLRQIGGRLWIRSRSAGATIRAVVPLGTRVIE